MSDFENNINEVIEDLKKKIYDISLLGADADKNKLDKINDVKQKAIAVLMQVKNKISDSVNSPADIEELQNAIEVVKARSKKLYDDAVSKVDEIIKDDNYQEVKHNIKEKSNAVKNDIDEFFEKEEVKNAVNNAKDVTIEVAEKAVNCLKEWLKPEDK